MGISATSPRERRALMHHGCERFRQCILRARRVPIYDVDKQNFFLESERRGPRGRFHSVAFARIALDLIRISSAARQRRPPLSEVDLE
jgi:hypothetical protein